MAVKVATITNVDATLNSFIVEGTLTVSASYPGSGNGDVLSFAGFDQIKSQSPPRRVDIKEQPPAGTSASGLIYNFSVGTTQANGKMQVFLPSGAGTPAGTIVSTSTAPTITTTSGGVTVALGVNAGALSEVTGASGITGVQAPTITSTFTGTAGSAAASVQLGNVTYASVSAANIVFRAEFPKFQ